MTTRLLQNVVKLLQSKIGAKLLQEGAYWRGASTLCTKVGVHCTQVHTVAHWHEIAQKHETKVHNAPGAPPSIQPHASALPPEKKRNKKRKLESSAFSTKLYKGLFSPTNQSSEVLASGDGGAGKVAINAHKEMEGALTVFEYQ